MMKNRVRLADESRESRGRAGDGEALGKVWACTGPIVYDPTALQQDIMRLRRR